MSSTFFNKPSATSIVHGWQGPMLWIRTVAYEKTEKSGLGVIIVHAILSGSMRGLTEDPLVAAAFRRIVLGAVAVGLLRWLRWCLPWRTADTNGERYRAFGFYLNVIRGPYACVFCGKATAQGADLQRGEPAHCSRCVGELDIR